MIPILFNPIKINLLENETTIPNHCHLKGQFRSVLIPLSETPPPSISQLSGIAYDLVLFPIIRFSQKSMKILINRVKSVKEDSADANEVRENRSEGENILEAMQLRSSWFLFYATTSTMV